ncbi:hypothetical protein GGR56DRAFT_659379 [Xylariaceae sp. FL0804]|nr:hypothetical protein GGR56DRAFT_659379 [Xylariaceae sp. FL0804]
MPQCANATMCKWCKGQNVQVPQCAGARSAGWEQVPAYPATRQVNGSGEIAAPQPPSSRHGPSQSLRPSRHHRARKRGKLDLLAVSLPFRPPPLPSHQANTAVANRFSHFDLSVAGSDSMVAPGRGRMAGALVCVGEPRLRASGNLSRSEPVRGVGRRRQGAPFTLQQVVSSGGLYFLAICTLWQLGHSDSLLSRKKKAKAKA